MSLKHRVRINLACVALDKRNPTGLYKILITNSKREMPNSLIYGDREIKGVVEGIISKHIKVNADWLNYRLINVSRQKVEDCQYELSLNYLGILPYPMETIKGRWVDLKDVLDGEEKINESYKKILSEAAGFIG